MMSVICVNLHRHMAQSVDIMNTLIPEGCVEVRKGLKGRGATTGGLRSRRDGTPGKPGFLRSKKCAQIMLGKIEAL
jgi:hypothetical protein